MSKQQTVNEMLILANRLNAIVADLQLKKRDMLGEQMKKAA